jgi:capsular polysaccharide biosynthesis protein
MATKDEKEAAPRPAEDAAADDDEGVDLAQIRDVAGYLFRAPRRRPVPFFTLLVLGLTTAVLAYVYYPRTYSTEVRILAQRNLVLPALGNPNRAVPREADNPTKNVGDTILQHENLVALIKQVQLLDRWEQTRPPLLQLKDRITERVAPLNEEDKLRALVGLLEKRLVVQSDENAITITVEWWDPEMAYEIASTVERNFIDAKYDAEVRVIDDAITILQGHADDERAAFEAARTEFEAAQEKSKGTRRTTPMPVAPRPAGGAVQHRAPPPQATATPAPVLDPAIMKALEEKRAAIKQIEDQRAARLADLNRQLSEALVTMAPAHPTVVGLRQRIADASVEPQELTQLKADERTLIEKLAASTPAPAPTTTAGPLTLRPAPAPVPGGAATSPLLSLVPEEDPAVTVARMKLTTAAQKFAELESRIDSAKIELDIARTAHKYRFSVVRPAEVSRRPRKPNRLALGGGGLLVALVLAFGGVALAERRRGRILEEWQIRRRLKLPVLGELEA